MGLSFLICGICLPCLLPTPVVAQAAGPKQVTQQQIQQTIDKACKALLGKLNAEVDAYAAIECVALLKAGYPGDHTEIRKVCDRICQRITSSTFVPGGHFIYEAAVSLMCLANADSVKYKPQIITLAKFIINNQGQNGAWHYPGQSQGDTSISQYGMLGLWEASRAGVEVPLEVWDKSAQWHLKYQVKDGGFAYHPDEPGAGAISLHSMTAGGIGSLQIARLYLYPDAKDVGAVEANSKKKVNKSGRRFGILTPVYRDEEAGAPSDVERISNANRSYVRKTRLAQIDEGLEKAMGWLSERFTVDRPTGYPVYYLYSLERAAALSHLEAIAGRDWYQEGAAHLVGLPAWSDASGDGPTTAFAILFLSRATAKMIHQNARRVAFGSGILIGGRGLPDDLKAAKVDDGKVKDKQVTPLEELLMQLENPQTVLMETTQAEIVERVVIGDRNALIGQVERLKKLAIHKDADIRRTALWALGRSGDLRLAPLLIKGLEDTDIDVYVEARNGLRCLSRSVEDFQPQDDPLDANTRKSELAKWQAWYREIREYSERDDFISKQ